MNVRCQNIKFLEENMAGNFTDIGLSNAFVDLTPKAREMSQYKQMRLHQTKKPLYSDTDYYQKKKRQSNWMGKISAIHISSKGLIYKTWEL